MSRPSSRARPSLESSFSATRLGNWEVPSAWGAAQGPAAVSSRRQSRGQSRGSSRHSRSRTTRTIASANGHLLPHMKQAQSSFVPSQETLYMTWREKQRLREHEKKELRRMVRRSMSTQDLAREIADASRSRRRPQSSGHGRPNQNRMRPATPDSIFGDDTPARPLSSGAPVSTKPSRSSVDRMSMDEAEDVVSAKETAVWVGSVPDSINEDELEQIMSMFGEVAAVSLRTKHGNKSWGFVLYTEPVIAKKVKSFGVVCHEEHTLKVKEPDFSNMSNGDMRSMAHVWREALKKTSHGRFIDDFRRNIESSVPGGANSVLRLFKEFRRKAGSPDNDIDVAEFGRALKACSIYLTDREVKRLHSAMDTDNNGQIGMDEFAAFVIGRYDALGAASNSGFSIGAIGSDGASKRTDCGQWRYKRPDPRRPGQAEQKPNSAITMSIWIGQIPHSVCSEGLLKSAVEKAFGPVDHVSVRRKGQDKMSWAMVVMQNQDDVTKGIVAGKLPVEDPSGNMVELVVQPVALKKELGNATGKLADVWRKTVSKTSHGKNLDLFRRKIESKIEGGPNSVLKLFKQFRQTAGSATNEITLDEFKFCVAKLNLGMSDSQAHALFSDIDMDHGGSIGLQEFELAILGRVGDLG